MNTDQDMPISEKWPWLYQSVKENWNTTITIYGNSYFMLFPLLFNLPNRWSFKHNLFWQMQNAAVSELLSTALFPLWLYNLIGQFLKYNYSKEAASAQITRVSMKHLTSLVGVTVQGWLLNQGWRGGGDNSSWSKAKNFKHIWKWESTCVLSIFLCIFSLLQSWA